MSVKILALFAIGIIALLVAVFYFFSPANGPGQYDDFAKCLTEKGAKFYGAFWCPHCADQKAAFGNSMKYVNYIECSPPSRNGQYQVCTDAGVNSYPTWIFADGTKENRVLSLQELGEKTSCSLTPVNSTR